MKSILIVLFVAISSLTTTYGQDTDKMSGTYEGYIDGMYVFTDKDGYNRFHVLQIHFPYKLIYN